MPYQFTTCAPLASSKTYVETKEECEKILKQVIALTNKHRRKISKRLVNEFDIECGARILFLDDTQEKVMDLVGKPIEITDLNLIDAEDYGEWFQSRDKGIRFDVMV